MRARKFDIRELGKSLANYAVAITLLLSFISTITNIFLFERWGLSFAIAATPTDILIGSLELYSVLLLPSIFIFYAMFLESALMRKFRAKRMVVKHKTAIRICLLALCASLIVFMWVFITFEQSQIMVTSLGRTGVVIISLLSSVIFVLTLWTTRAKTIRRFFLLTTVSFFLFGISLFNLATNRSSSLILLGEGSRCAGNEYVVWVGTGNIVTSCHRPPFDNKGEYFILKRDGANFRIPAGKRVLY